MANLRIQQILEQVLGQSRVNEHTGEVGFHCPFCKHHKKKFNIHVPTEKWQCWVCSAKGRTISSLFRKLKVSVDILNKLSKITGKKVLIGNSKKYEELFLPSEFIPLHKAKYKSPEYKNAIHYLMTRGLRKEDILRHNIGYCENGKYEGMIIIPSYDSEGNLNFFTGRSYYESAKYRHNNPRVSKDIIGFDLFINWDEPITVVEGAFDAISSRINTIPLFGKLMLDSLKTKIIQNKVDRINIALDRDALPHALKMAEYFLNLDKEVHLIELGDKDPSEMGHSEFTKLVDNSAPLNFSKVMEYKFLC